MSLIPLIPMASGKEPLMSCAWVPAVQLWISLLVAISYNDYLFILEGKGFVRSAFRTWKIFFPRIFWGPSWKKSFFIKTSKTTLRFQVDCNSIHSALFTNSELRWLNEDRSSFHGSEPTPPICQGELDVILMKHVRCRLRHFVMSSRFDSGHRCATRLLAAFTR